MSPYSGVKLIPLIVEEPLKSISPKRIIYILQASLARLWSEKLSALDWELDFSENMWCHQASKTWHMIFSVGRRGGHQESNYNVGRRQATELKRV